MVKLTVFDFSFLVISYAFILLLKTDIFCFIVPQLNQLSKYKATHTHSVYKLVTTIKMSQEEQVIMYK